jgi:Tol biopolymer transport system component
MNRSKIVRALAGRALLAAGLCAAHDVSALQTQSEPVNMGPIINSAARDAEPTFTPDGNTMYFNCVDRNGRTGADICVSTRSNGEWSVPEIVGPPISTEYLEVEPLLSPDGSQLYVMSDRPGGLGGPDIWVSDLVNGEWTEPRNLGAPINSPYADHCIYFWGDNWDVAYWTSTRPGGYGGNDIWTSRRVDGVWQEAVNLGPNVNSEVSDHHSLPSEDGRSLYVTSARPGGYGGEDIYVTTRDETGAWGPMVNLGPLVNSDRDDRCPAFTPDHTRFLFDSEREGGYGSKDLWWVYYSNIEAIGRGSAPPG